MTNRTEMVAVASAAVLLACACSEVRVHTYGCERAAAQYARQLRCSRARPRRPARAVPPLAGTASPASSSRRHSRHLRRRHQCYYRHIAGVFGAPLVADAPPQWRYCWTNVRVCAFTFWAFATFLLCRLCDRCILTLCGALLMAPLRCSARERSLPRAQRDH